MRRPSRRILASAKASELVRFGCDSIEITAAAGDGEKKGPPSFSVRAYNGGELVLNGWDLPVVIDLEGLEFSKSITANLDHDPRQRVGHVTESKKFAAHVMLHGFASADSVAAREFIGSGLREANAYPWQASIEALVPRKSAKEIRAGEKVTVNGKSFTGPLYVAKKSKLHGVAFLSRGADENTSVKIAAAAAGDENMEFSKWIEAMGLELSTLSDKAKATLQKQYDAEVKASKKDDEGKPIVAAPKFDVDEIRAEYSKLTTDIEVRIAKHEDQIRDKAKLGERKLKAIEAAQALKRESLEQEMASPVFAVKAIKIASDLEIDLLKMEASHAGPAVGGSRREFLPLVIEAAMCMTLKTPGLEKQFDDQTLEAARKQFRRGIGLQQMLIMAAVANGCDVHAGERITDANIKRILKYAMPDEDLSVKAGFTTVTLPGIFANTANKELLAGYMEEDQSWREVAAVRTVTDFKQVTAYRLLDNLEYEKLGASGEIKHGTLGEESYTRQAATYAKMLALTRENIINDDLGAFEDLRSRLGRGAAQKFNNVFWTAFMSNAATFWTTARTNYIEGATTNLGTDGVGLGLGVKAFRQMRSPSADGSKRVGALVAGRPEILLVPPELEAIADNLFANRNLGAVKVADANIYAGKYRPVVVPWLSDSNFTGYSTTAWFLLMNPAVRAAVVVSFLNGMQQPTVESAEADFNTLGIQFRGYHDFGADQAEYLCGVKSKGAA